MSWNGYKPYVSVGERKAQAQREIKRLQKKKGFDIKPIEIQGRKITKNFWGQAWCDHLESFSDFSNRLPRGRTYTRNGSIYHLDIEKGAISAYVAGSELYEIKIQIDELDPKKWKAIRQNSTNQIGSLLDLLQGKIPQSVLESVTNQQDGLFPTPKEIKLQCDCPDYAHMCKHIAAVLYGVGARLDSSPELLFELRGVDVEELIDSEVGVAQATSAGNSERRTRIAADSLGDVFGIEIALETDQATPEKRKPSRKKTVAKKKTGKGKSRLKPITGEQVKKLRDKFGMDLDLFSRLIEVGPTTIRKWEKNPGTLNLKEDSLKKFKAAQRLTITKAWEKVDD